MGRSWKVRPVKNSKKFSERNKKLSKQKKERFKRNAPLQQTATSDHVRERDLRRTSHPKVSRNRLAELSSLAAELILTDTGERHGAWKEKSPRTSPKNTRNLSSLGEILEEKYGPSKGLGKLTGRKSSCSPEDE